MILDPNLLSWHRMRLTADGSRPAASEWAISRCKALPKAICLALNKLPIQKIIKKKLSSGNGMYPSWIKKWLALPALSIEYNDSKKSLCHVKSKLCNSKPGSNLCVNPRRSSKFMIACTASSCQEWTSRTMAHLHTVLMRSEKPSDDYFSIAMMACIFSCLLTPQNLR